MRPVGHDQLGCSVSQLAIAWTLANPAIHLAIVSAQSRGISRRR